MKEIFKKIPYLFIIILLGYVVYLRECTPKPDPVYITDTITYRDTTYIPQIDTLKFTDTIYLDSIIRQIIIKEKLDTIIIFREHFTLNTYKDTILNDSNGFIVISDTIYRNKIKSRLTSIKLYPQRIKPTLLTKYYIGVGINGGRDRMGLSANVGILTKKDYIYTLKYDLINKEISFNLYLKLWAN